MSPEHTRSTAPPLSIEGARELVRGAGLRGTPARLAVVQCLTTSLRPLTHAEVSEKLADRGFDQSTIYRCLMELSEAGVLTRLDLGDSIRRYERVSSDIHAGPEHPHFMCVDCGSISCLVDYRFRLSPSQNDATPVGEITEVLVKGHCRECLAGNP